jgi:hypothetical protein
MASDGPRAAGAVFTDNNHWRFGWGSGLYNFQEQFLPLWITYGPCRYQPKSFDIEIGVNARKIADAATRPIYVAMSGGLDSELVARTMLKEKIPFTPIIAQFENNYNKDDILYAFDFCRKNGLEPHVLKVDILALFKDSINTPYVLANCASVLYMQIMRHVDRLGGMTVMGAGEHRYQNVNGKIVLPIPYERIGTMNFIQAEGVQAAFPFYGYTPELMLSTVREAKAHGFMVMDKFAHNVKEDMYRKYWPDLTLRPKYSGFEMVAKRRSAAQHALQEKYGPLIVHYEIPLDELEKQLSGGRY